MSLEVIKEMIRVNQMVGTEVAQAIIENDIIVPDTKPDILRILTIDGDVGVNHTEVLQEKVLINGTIALKILYVSDEPSGSIRSINSDLVFTHSLQVEKAKSGMKCRVKCETEHMEYEILNGRKISVRAILRMEGKLTQELSQEMISGIKPTDQVQTLKENLKMNSYLGENQYLFNISEGLEVPAGKPSIREILRNDIKITGKDYKITDNKVAAKGEVNISTLYMGEEEEQGIQFMEHEIPFTQFIDLEGIEEAGSCEMEYRIGESSFELGEDSDGEVRIIQGNIAVEIWVSGSKAVNMDVISDAYCPGSKLILEKELVTVEEAVADNKGQIILKDTLVLEDEGPEIAEVLNVLCNPILTEVKIYDDKVTVEGLVNANVLYLANNNEEPVSCLKQEIPFKHGVDLKGVNQGMSCEPEANIEHCSYSMVSGSEVEVRLVIGLSLKVTDRVVHSRIVNIEEAALEEQKLSNAPSVIIYFTKPGDNLWKIAKNYLTTVEYLENANNLPANSVLLPGQQIMIPKKQELY